MSIISIVSLIVSIVGCLLFASIFSVPSTIPLFVIFAIASIVIPPIAKAQRLKEGKKGTALEIIAIVIGGFNFYCIFFALTSLPIFLGYLGWIVCAIVYKIIKV